VALEKTWDFFLESYREIVQLGLVGIVLEWDGHTFMPREAADNRGEQKALLATISKEKFLDPRFKDAVLELSQSWDLSDDQMCIVQRVKRELENAERIPLSLSKEIVIANEKCMNVWLEARKANDFKSVISPLKEVLRLKREEGRAKDRGDDPYDSLLDGFDEGLSAATLFSLFTPLEDELVKLHREALERCRKASQPKQPQVSKEGQLALYQYFLDVMHLPTSRSRVDLVPHPMAYTCGPRDQRVGVRLTSSDFSVSLSHFMHELGHVLYEDGFEEQYYFTPLGQYSTMSIHESQSLLWERYLGLGNSFSEYLSGVCRARNLGNFSAAEIYGSANWVEANPLRIESNELSYPLHIMIRFRLERAMILEDLPVEDLPALWAEMYEKLLGITPKNDSEGCMQDVHWFAGFQGYFPTYLLGAFSAAQLFDAYRNGHPSHDDDVRAGNFLPLLTWLREKVHRHGRRYLTAELIERATGKEFSSKSYLQNLREKFGSFPNYRSVIDD
jgi:carboxypeptidase Taq